MNPTHNQMQHKHPLLLLHGALGSKDQFVGLKESLIPELEVFDLNFSGHGGKSFSDSFSIDGFVTEIVEFLEAQKNQKVSIFGYSMGGYVALSLALKHPELVEKIFTLGTKLEWSPEIAAREIKMLNPEVIESKVPQFAAALQKRHAPNDWRELMRRTARLMTGLGSGQAIPIQSFSGITQKVVIGWGSLDNMVSQEESAAVADILPNGTLKIFDGFKHPIEQADTKILAGSILDFF